MIKKIFILLSIVPFTALAQVGVNTITPAAGSVLDIQSTDKGMLIPRLNIVDLTTIAPVTGGSPVGLLAYNTNTTSGVGLHYWNGTRWNAVGSERAWALTGNAGTTASNYIGTTDTQPLRLSTNGTARLIIPNAAQIHANALGTQALPFYSFAADTNTGIWSPGADQLAFSTNGAERMRMNSDNRILMNTTTLVAGDVLRVVAGTNEAAINGYATNSIGTYGEATTGIGAWGIAFSTGDGVWADASTGHGVWASATSGIGVRSDVTTGIGVRGTASGANATGVLGIANNGTLAFGVWGSSTAGYGLVGQSTTGIGVYGSSTSATSYGGNFINSNLSGTGAIISGQNVLGTYLTAGSGAAVTGSTGGLFALATNTTSGWGVLSAGNNVQASTLAGGGGGSFTGRQWGVYGNAAITGAASNATDRAAFVGNFISAGTTAATVYVGARIGGTVYKILGGGGASGASVSTYMPTRDGQRILFAPESPENWFFDLGEAQLVNGKATVIIDPIFVDCISNEVPFKVFVQGAEDILGTIAVKRNQNNKTFELTDTGGASNGIVQYKIYGIWKGKENLRLPKYEQPFEYQELRMEEVREDENVKIEKLRNENINDTKANDPRMKAKSIEKEIK